MKRRQLIIAAALAMAVLVTAIGCSQKKTITSTEQTQMIESESPAAEPSENETLAAESSESESPAAEPSENETLATESQESQTPEKAGDETNTVALADGIYDAEFHSDSSMFHINEANEGKGTLTVEQGVMTIHISLPSKNIVNLFVGTAEDAKKEGAELLEPTTDTVTYSDGMSEEVYGFDVPVPAIDEEFDLALIGSKGNWYDHKVSITNPVAQTK